MQEGGLRWRGSAFCPPSSQELRTRSASFLLANLASRRSRLQDNTSQMCDVSPSACAGLKPLDSNRFTCASDASLRVKRTAKVQDAPEHVCPQAVAPWKSAQPGWRCCSLVAAQQHGPAQRQRPACSHGAEGW